MRLRVADPRLRCVAAIFGLVAVGLMISACSTAGLGLGGDVTGSTRPTLRADLSQPMPSAVGPYTPGADIGSGQSGAMQSPTASPTVTTAALPPVSSSPVASSPTMTAQSSLATREATAAPASMPANAFYHTIESGESLYSIARRYSVTTQAIVEANQLSSPDRIYVGQRIAIPGRPDLAPSSPAMPTAAPAPALVSPAPVIRPQTTTTASVSPAQTITAAPVTVQGTPANPPAATAAGNFRWPAQGRLIADFRASHGTGINIELPEGSSIHAAENGTVIYVGDTVEGYGNLVLIRHANGYVSAYAHLKQISVARNQIVNRGDVIGTAGMTGSVTRPQLHFELRQGATPVDPIPLLA